MSENAASPLSAFMNSPIDAVRKTLGQPAQSYPGIDVFCRDGHLLVLSYRVRFHGGVPSDMTVQTAAFFDPDGKGLLYEDIIPLNAGELAAVAVGKRVDECGLRFNALLFKSGSLMTVEHYLTDDAHILAVTLKGDEIAMVDVINLFEGA